MTGQHQALMAALAFLGLIGLGLSGLLVAQAHERLAKREARLREAVHPYRKIRYTELRAFRPAPAKDRSLTEIAASVFGFSPERADQYPVPWWAVLIAGLVASRLVVAVPQDIIGPVALLGIPVPWVVLCRTFFALVVSRRQEALVSQFPDVLDMIVRSVRVGIPVRGAISGVAREARAPTSHEFTRLANDIMVGVPLEKAVADMGARNDLAEYRFFATAIGLQAQTGGALTETLENLADLIRKRIALRERGHALSSEARTSALILGSLPVLMGLVLWLLNPAYMSLLLNDRDGRAMLGAALLSLACGGVTMKVIIGRSLS